jgi:hypothetical protein
MLKVFISCVLFFAFVFVAAPVMASDEQIAQMLDALNKQVQEQQMQIEELLRDRQQAQKSNYYDVAKPSVVAPLRPTPLGTLRASEIDSPRNLAKVLQDEGVAKKPLPFPIYDAKNPPPPEMYEPHPASTYILPKKEQAMSTSAATPQTTKPLTAVSSDVAPEHVGAAPTDSTKPPEVQALANVGGVLTPYGKVVVEPFLQYSRSSVNTFAFEGTELVPSFLVGVVSANQTSRDLVTSGGTFRVGVTDRLELEARLPFVYRTDSFTSTIPNASGQLLTTTAEGSGLGDIELAGHYQINDGREDWPFFVGNLRLKTDTGTSPYEVAYNSDGSARDLATGSGFMAIEPSLTAIYPSDPAILFANIGYIHSFAKDINKNIAGNAIGRVEPGDTIKGSVGMGIALNDKLSFTLGYEHDYVRPTMTEIGGVTQNSQVLQIGSALTGISYRVSNRTSINLNLSAGVTRDAPDAVIGIRVPVTLQAF